jgi:ribosomal protein S18 acetylase RimI-like enzyme
VAEDILIRPAGAADVGAVAAVRRASWKAAYAGIIDGDIIDSVTAPRPAAARQRPHATTVVAVAGQRAEVVGFATFGPERTVAFPPAPPVLSELTAAGAAGQTGEVYAIYLVPARWSDGIGRVLMDAALARLREAGYRRVVLWVLTANARARRFYDKAGFAADGGVNVLSGLGGVEELRYAREL